MKNYRTVKGLIISSAVLLASPFAFAKFTQAQEVTFKYVPQDGQTYRQKITTFREQKINKNQSNIEEMVATSEFTVNKAKQGWTITAKPIQIEAKINGQQIEGPSTQIADKQRMTYHVNPGGKLLGVTGFEDLVKSINNQFKDQAALNQMLNAKALEEKEIQEWRGRIGDYVGETVHIGETKEGLVPFNLPNGNQINYLVKTHFGKFEPCGKTQCIRIEQTYDSQSEGINKLANEALPKHAKSSKDKKANTYSARDARVKGKISRLVDPETMTIYAEEQERTIKMFIRGQEKESMPIHILEHRVFEFDYNTKA